METEKSGRRYLLKTLGCKANLADSQLIEAELRRRGWEPAAGEDEGADLCIVNSCTVTDDADRQSRKLASRLSRENPGGRVVMTGCAAEVDPERMKSSRGIDFVVGNQDKPRLVDLVIEALDQAGSAAQAGGVARGEILGGVRAYGQMLSRHPMDREWAEPEAPFLAPRAEPGDAADPSETSRTRAFLKIQEGCDSFCTYCVIPYGRGPSRSLGIPELVRQVAGLVEQGVREVVLTGTNIGDYGSDWRGQPALEELVEALLGETRLERLRVSSLDPVEITPRLLGIMATDPRLCPHLHVSLQSPHSRVLRLMKRKYGAEDVERCLEAIARIPAPPGGPFVGMDVITGFPGETEEEFEWGRQALARLPWSRLHVFPYSERSGTPATRLPGRVEPEVRARRASTLREMSLERLMRIHQEALSASQKAGEPIRGVLLESRTRGPDGSGRWISGYSPNYLRVLIPASDGLSPGGTEAAASLARSNQIVDAQPLSLVVDRASGDVAFLGRLSRP